VLPLTGSQEQQCQLTATTFIYLSGVFLSDKNVFSRKEHGTSRTNYLKEQLGFANQTQ